MSIAQHEKNCYCCKLNLPIGQFSRDKTRKDGYHPYCKACKLSKKSDAEKLKDAARSKKYYEQNRDKVKKYIKQYKKQNKDKYRAFATEYKKRSVLVLSDVYVRETLVKLGFAQKVGDIDENFVDAYRLVMAIRREARKEQ